MTLLNHIKSGAKIASPLLIIFYILSLAGDLGTTYLASPDLKYEGNWIVRHFNLHWNGIILMVVVIVTFTIFYFLISTSYLHTYYRTNSLHSDKPLILEILRRKRLLFSCIGLCCLYSHISHSYFICINNYLGYIYLFKQQHFLTTLSHWYIDSVVMKIPHLYTWYQAVFISAGIIVTIFKVREIRSKYRAEFSLS